MVGIIFPVNNFVLFRHEQLCSWRNKTVMLSTKLCGYQIAEITIFNLGMQSVRYRQAPQFDMLLLRAFEGAVADQGSQKAVCEKAGLERERMSISRWHDQDVAIRKPLKEALALKLWNYLSPQYVEAAIAKESDIAAYKKNLYSEGELADSIMGFFAVHEKNNRSQQGLVGKYIAYKRSFLYKDKNSYEKVVRSLWSISFVDNSYFNIIDLQASEKSSDGIKTYEKSSGLGFIKSNRLWVLLREDGDGQFGDQPRVFCFPRMAPYGTYGKILKGYVIESSRIARDTFFHSPVYLMPIERERSNFKEKYGIEFDENIYMTVIERKEIEEIWPEIEVFLYNSSALRDLE